MFENAVYAPALRSFRVWLAPRRNALVATTIVFTALMVIWLYGGQWYRERLLLEERAEAVSDVSARGSVLSSAVNRRLARLQGLHAFVMSEAREPDFEQKFELFAADLYAGSSAIRNLAVSPGGVASYVYPLEGNETVLGYNPLEDWRPEVVADVQKAINSEQVVISSPIDLIQGGLGIVARQGVFLDGEYWGLVTVVIDLPQLLTESGFVEGSSQLDFALRDEGGKVFFGSPSLFSGSPIITQVLLSEGYWELAGAPGSGWSMLSWQPLWTTLIGSLVCINLLAALVYVTINRQNRLAQAVMERTRELSEINIQLEKRVEERTLELTMLLNISRSISSTLELSVLLEQVLDKLMPVVEYTGGAILTLEDGNFTICAYRGPFPVESTINRRFSFDNIIGKMLLEQQTAVVIPDLTDETPLALAFQQTTGIRPDQNPYLRSFMAVPLIARENVIGVLTLHHREPGIYNKANAELALAFANQVAVAIENARLLETSQNLAVLQERQRLARELHDSVSQALYGIALGIRTAHTLLLRSQMDDTSKAALGEPLDYVLSLSEGGLADMRSLLFELRPESLEQEGLTGALTKQIAALQARYHIHVDSNLDIEPEVPLVMKEVLYRVGQEALHNIVKHAEATSVVIDLHTDDGKLVLEIGDNGRGFDLNGNFIGHYGLRTMRERVERVGGSLIVNSSSDRGTHIVASVPLS